MKLWKHSMTGLAAMGLLAAPALADDHNTGEIDVNLEVLEFVEIEVIDAELNWETDGTQPLQNDLAGKPVEDSRALFEVRANAGYTLLVEPSTGTWLPSDLPDHPTSGTFSTYREVKFESATDDTFIGGVLYLDGTPESTAGADFYYFNTEGGGTNFVPESGHILTEERSAGIHTWGISAAFAPAKVGDPSNPNGIPGALAAPGTYSTTALITASVD